MLRRVAVLLSNPLSLEVEAKTVEQAVARAIEAGARTADLGGKHSTSQMGEIVRGKLV